MDEPANVRVVTRDTTLWFSRRPGVRTPHLIAPVDGARESLSGLTDFDEGAELPLHAHNCEETIYIVEGEARFEAGQLAVDLTAADSAWTPAGTIHRFGNRGRGRLRLLWSYRSSAATRTFAETGVSTVIADEPWVAAASELRPK